MIKRIAATLALALAFSLSALSQSTTVIGTFKDGGGGTVISSGQVAATLTPGIDTVASGFARFSPTEVDCSINGASVATNQAVRAANSVTISGLTGHTFIVGDTVQVASMTDSTFNGTFTITGTTATSITYAQTAGNATSGGGTLSALRAIPSNGACTVATNTLMQPSGTSWKFCVQPGFIQPGSCFVAFATGGTLDITSQPATPSLTPAYTLVDTFSNQSIAGAKTFTGSVTFGGTLTLGAITLGGNLALGSNAITSITGITDAGDETVCALCVRKWGSSGTSSPDTGFSRIGAGILGVGNGAQADATGTVRAKIFQIGGSDTGISRAGAGIISFGNGAQGDKSAATQATAYVDASANPALSGVVRTGNNVCAVAARNAANSGDVCAVQVNGSNQTIISSLVLGSNATLTEAAAPSGVASSDILYADSTAHRLKMNNNNGGALTVAATSGDTFTSTTLTSPSIGGTVSGGATYTSPVLSSPQITGAIAAGSGYARGSVATCAIGAGVGAACANTITWSATLSSSTYNMLCEMDSPNTTATTGNTGAKTTTTATVSSINLSAGTGLSSGTVRCIAIP